MLCGLCNGLKSTVIQEGMSGLTKHFLILFLAFCPLLARAMIVPIEGFVNVSVVLAGEQQVLWSLKASGNEFYDLISLDARTGKEQWRIKQAKIPGSAVTNGRDIFYFVCGDALTAARLSNGQILWQTNLFGVPARTNAPPQQAASSTGEIVVLPMMAGFGTSQVPNRFIYTPLHLSGRMLVIGRQGLNGGGCCWMGCFQDWLVIDQRNGKIVDGGPGEIMASGKNLVAGDKDFTFQIREGEKLALPQLAEVLKKVSSLPNGWVHNEVNDWMLIAETHTQRASATAFAVPARISLPLKLGKRDYYQQGWVALKDGFLRYSEYYSTGTMEKADPEQEMFWIELYDLQGRLRTQQTTKKIKGWTSFIGVNAQGRVILAVEESLVTVETPSLKMKRWETKPGASFYMVSDGKRLICARGDWSANEMKKTSETREVVITSVDAETFVPVWEHREKVKVRKMQ